MKQTKEFNDALKSTLEQLVELIAETGVNLSSASGEQKRKLIAACCDLGEGVLAEACQEREAVELRAATLKSIIATLKEELPLGTGLGEVLCHIVRIQI